MENLVKFLDELARDFAQVFFSILSSICHLAFD